MFNPLNAKLNPICHLLALLGGATIVVVSRLRVNIGMYHTYIVNVHTMESHILRTLKVLDLYK